MAKPTLEEIFSKPAPAAARPSLDEIFKAEPAKTAAPAGGGMAVVEERREVVTKDTPGAVQLPGGGWGIPADKMNQGLPADVMKPSVEVKPAEQRPDLGQIAKRGLEIGKMQVDRGRIGAQAVFGKIEPEEAVQKIKELESSIGPEITPEFRFTDPYSVVANVVGEVSQLLPFMGEGMKESFEYGVKGAGGGAAIGGFVLPGVGALGGALTGARAGATLGIIKSSAEIEGGNLYADLIKDGVSHETAREIAIPVGFFIGAVEASQMGTIARRIPGLNKLLKKKMTDAVISNPVLRQRLMKAGTNFLGDVAEQTAQEEVQELLQIGGEVLAKTIEESKTDKEFDKPTWKSALDRMGQVLKTSLLSFPVLQLPGAAVETYSAVKGPKAAEAPKGATVEVDDMKNKAGQEVKPEAAAPIEIPGQEAKKEEKAEAEKTPEPPKVDETKFAETVKKGGGTYKGYTPPSLFKGKVFGDDVFFNSPGTNTTLVLKAKDLTPENVRRKIFDSNNKFLLGGSKMSDQDVAGLFGHEEGQDPAISVLKAIRDEVGSGEPGGRIFNEDTREVSGYGSTYPDYFKNKGYAKEEVLKIIDKWIAKKPITERQFTILKDLAGGIIQQRLKEAENYEREAARLEEESSRAEAEGSSEAQPSASPDQVQGDDASRADESGKASQEVDTSFDFGENAGQSLIPGTEKPTYRKAQFGEGRELPPQKEDATPLQEKSNESKQGDFLAEPGQQYNLPNLDASGILKSEKEVANDGKNPKKIIAALSGREGNIKVVAGPEASAIWESNFALELRKTGSLYFPQKKVTSPADIAFAFQSLTNEVQEHFFIGAIKDGEIVAVELVHIGAIDYSLVSIFDLVSLLQSHKADSFFMVHNHPSGRLEPSREDLDLSQKGAAALKKAGFEFAGHVIINDTKFGFIDSNFNYQIEEHAEYKKIKNVSVFKKYGEWLKSKSARTKITDPENVYEIIKGIKTTQDQAVVIFLDKSNHIQNTIIFPKSAINTEAIVRATSASRATSIVMANSGLTPRAIKELQKNLQDFSVKVLDSIEKINETTYESAAQKGIIADSSFVMEDGQQYGKNPFDEAQEALESTESEEVKKERKDFKLFERAKEIIRKYAERVGERFVPRGAQGMFFSRTNNIRLMALNNLSTVTHEVTHYLDKKYRIIQDLINSTKRGNSVRKRLTQLYVEHYPGGKKNHKLAIRMAEGMAMLFQRYIENPAQMQADYGDLVNDFLKPGGRFFKPEFEEFVKDARSIIEEFESLDPTDQIGARIADTKQVVVKQSYFNLMDKIAEFIADSIYPIEKLGQVAGLSWTGKDPSLWLRQYKNLATVIMTNLKGWKGYWSYRSGKLVKLFDFNWKTIVDALQKRGETPLFGRWLVARRQHFGYLKLDELTEGLKAAALALKEARESGDVEAFKEAAGEFKQLSQAKTDLETVLRNDNFSRDVVTKVYEEHKQRFVEEEKMFDSLVRADLELLADQEVMLITPEQYSQLSKNEGYATFKRDVYDDIIGENGIPLSVPRPGGTKASSMIGRTGSELAILNPLYGSLLNHAEIMRKSMKQVVYNKMLPLSEKLPELFQRVPLKAHVESDGTISYPQEYSLKESIIMSRENYKRVPIQTDRGIKKVLDDVLTYKNVDFAREMIITMNRVFTRGTTSGYPPFAIVNFFVDQISAAAQTRNNYTPIFDTLRTVAKALQNHATDEALYFEEYLVMGGERQTLAGWQDMQPDELFRKIAAEKGALEKIAEGLDAGISILALPAQYSEIATRAAEYIKARLAGKEQIVALEEAGRVSAPFHHVGSWGGSEFAITWIKGVPFLNATIQVLSEYGSTITDPARQKRAAAVFGMVTAALLSSMSGLMLLGDDEDKENYKSLEPAELANFIWLPNPFGKGLLKLRIPNQMGAFGTLVNMFLANRFLNSNYEIGDFIDAGTSWIPDQFNPMKPIRLFVSWIPQLAKPFMEAVVFEKKTYPTVRPIESMGLQYKEPRARYYETTSSFAKYVGNLLNISPIKIDHLIEGYLGRQVRLITGKGGKNPLHAAIDLTRQAVVRDFYFTGGRNLLDYYDKKDETMQKFSAIKSNDRPFSEKERATVLRNRYLIFGDKNFKGIDDLLKIYRDAEKADKNFKGSEGSQKLETAILDLISQLK